MKLLPPLNPSLRSLSALLRANGMACRLIPSVASTASGVYQIPFMVSSANGAYRTMSGGWRLTQ